MRDSAETATEEVDRIMDEDYALGRMADQVLYLVRRTIETVDPTRRGAWADDVGEACDALATYARGILR